MGSRRLRECVAGAGQDAVVIWVAVDYWLRIYRCGMDLIVSCEDIGLDTDKYYCDHVEQTASVGCRMS